MIKNNLQIIIEIPDGNGFKDSIVEIDDSTVFALTFKGVDPKSPSERYLTYSNEFSIPVTRHNKDIFEFYETIYSNARNVYENRRCAICVDGVKTCVGTLNLVSTDGKRYNLNFIEDKNFFTLLEELPILHTEKTSLADKIVNDWGLQIVPEIIREYGDFSFNSIVSYTNATDANGWPINDYIMPIVLNSLNEEVYSYSGKNSADSEDNVPDTFENDLLNTTTTEDSDMAAKGLVVCDMLYEATWHLNSEEGGNKFYVSSSAVEDQRKMHAVEISPLWVSLDRVVSLFENYTGYQIEGLVEASNRFNNGKKLFIHCSGCEFAIGYNASQTVNSSGTITTRQTTQNFLGYIRKLKNEDYNGTEEIGENSYDKTCLDLLKVLMQEYCLGYRIDKVEKKIYFKPFNDIIEEINIPKLKLISFSKKEPKINNIEQNNVIKYSNVSDGDTFAGSLNLICNNKNLKDEANRTFFDINRCLWQYSPYKRDGEHVYKRSTNVTDMINAHDLNKEILFATVTKTPYGITREFRLCATNMSVLFNDMASATRPQGLLRYSTHQLYNDVDNPAFVDGTAIYVLTQPALSGYSESPYRKFQDIIYEPTSMEVEVLKDVLFIKDFSQFAKVHIDGLVGEWYVSEISSFNPRIDSTLKLSIVKA